jgi:hypothetical protein
MDLPSHPAPSPAAPRGDRQARRRRARSPRIGALVVLGLGCAAGDAPTAGTQPPPDGGGEPALAVVRPGNPGAADVRFSVDATVTKPISPFIYGMNLYTDWIGQPASAFPWYGATPPAGVTLNRFGGNRLTAYNWENNFSNAGNDYNFSNDAYLSPSRTPGEAVRSRASASFARGAAFLATVPMIGHVAADGNGPTGSSESGLRQRLATRFVASVPRKGAPFTLSPSLTDGKVYQDEFVNWVTATFPGAIGSPTRPIFFSLDNEPDIWHTTHEEIRSTINGQPNLLTYDGFAKTTIDHAAAIKAVAPGAVVFGPAVATYAGAATLGRWPSPDPAWGSTFFLDVYLDKLRAAEQQHGRRLVDVLDLHWYPAAGAGGAEITNDYAPQSDAMIQARVQAPRSLWDPTYDEGSWVNQVAGGPIQLLPSLRQRIAARYPGTRIAISEYYYGRGGDISGGVAQADVLGIFGREGVFAATLWPNAGVWAYGGDGAKAYAYLFGAFRSFRDYDGQGGAFGNLGASATTTDRARSSVYASADDASYTGPHRVVVVAINKTKAVVSAAVLVTDSRRLTRSEVYVLAAGSPTPARKPDITIGTRNAFIYRMPPLSVTTLVLRP